MRYYTKEQIERLLSNPALSFRDRVVANLQLGCALRRCETVGLSMRDVRLPIIDLPQAIVKGGKRKVNPSHGRKFEVPNAASIPVLQAWYDKRIAEGAGPSDPFITTRTGKRMSKRNLSLIWDKIAAAVPENRLGSHSGRHSLSTLMLEENSATLRDVQKLLGHKSIIVTEKTYCHDVCTLKPQNLFAA